MYVAKKNNIDVQASFSKPPPRCVCGKVCVREVCVWEGVCVGRCVCGKVCVWEGVCVGKCV